jgi:hypothetical protein
MSANDSESESMQEMREIVRKREASPEWQRIKTLAAKIDSGTATREEEDEFDDLCPPMPPNLIGNFSIEESRRLSREYLAQKRKERAEKEAAEARSKQGL